MVTFEQIRDVFNESVTLPVNVSEDFNLKNLNLDSLDWVDIVMSIEKEFNISITLDELKNFNTIGDVLSLVNKEDNSDV